MAVREGICGVDEAGRGSVMGPLVVAAVFADSDEPFISMGARDSKKLTPKVREKLYREITRSYDFHVTRVSASEIDEMRNKMSLNDIEMSLFAQVCGKGSAVRYYADCFGTDERAFSNRLSALLGGATVIAKHGGDDLFPVVSAASIVAKVERDRAIEAISHGLGKDIGSGYPSDAKTMDFIEKWISSKGNPPPETRTSWDPVRKLMTVSRNTKLTDW